MMLVDDARKRRKQIFAEWAVFIALNSISFLLLVSSSKTFIINFKDRGLSFFFGIRSGIHEISSFVSQTILSIQELNELQSEYEELVERVSRYEQLEQGAAEIRQENQRLREQLGFAESLTVKHIAAEIVGKDPNNLFSAFAINKGKKDGVAVNMPVIAFQRGMQGLVGKIIVAGDLESLVMPLYDSNFFISSRFSETRYEGIIGGQGADAPLLMRFVPKSARAEISSGDVILSSGIGGVYPPGITIGRVAQILYREYEISMDIEINTIIDFSRLEYVFVIDPL
ncbi:MAG: rod shape-determining protein MreC [Spirochaetaceae bacterium]|jgi:rod shape-determining protein MreC|nr:rod shape-determining protein MreC [Spirochaetaceae bacterium]